MCVCVPGLASIAKAAQGILNVARRVSENNRKLERCDRHSLFKNACMVRENGVDGITDVDPPPSPNPNTRVGLNAGEEEVGTSG